MKDLENGLPIIIDVTNRNFHNDVIGEWSKKILLQQLNTENEKWINLAGSFIWTLRRERLDGRDYIDLLEAYCKSRGCSKNIDDGINYFVDKFEGKLPDSIIDFCQNAINYGLSKDRNSSEYNGTLCKLPELVFKYYRENKNRSSKRARALDLIDKMCKHSIGIYHRDFKEIER